MSDSERNTVAQHSPIRRNLFLMFLSSVQESEVSVAIEVEERQVLFLMRLSIIQFISRDKGNSWKAIFVVSDLFFAVVELLNISGK